MVLKFQNTSKMTIFENFKFQSAYDAYFFEKRAKLKEITSNQHNFLLKTLLEGQNFTNCA